MNLQSDDTKLYNGNTIETGDISSDLFHSYKTELRYYVDRLLEEKEKNMLLLSDKVLTQEQDVEFWKNKYFELELENKKLREEIRKKVFFWIPQEKR